MSDLKFYCRAEDLAIGYGKTPLMEHIGLGVGKGTILTLIGPNGAGKSTLLKTLAAQLAPQGGAVLLDGKNLADYSGPERARKMALMVPHTRRTELTTCFEMASAGRYPYTGRLGVLSAEDKRQVHAALALVGAEALAGRDFNRISDGQRQRVLLARAICQQPELILLDEPTSFLDIKGKAELLAILKSLARDKKMAVILSLHELELAQKVSDKVVCVSAAGVSDVMTPEKAFARENICKIYALTDEQYAFLYGEEKVPEEKRPLFEHYVRSGQKLLRCGYTTGTCAALGAAGAAISTTLCRIAGMGMMIAAFYANVRGEKIRLSLLKPFPKDLLLRLLGIGLPSGGESLSYNLSQMTSLVFVNTLGAYVVTTRMYANMLAQVCYTLIQAVSQAGQILVGYHIGARDFDGADRENRHILKTFVPVTVGITLVLWLFARPIYGFLSKDPQIVALGAQVMLVEVFLEIGRSFNIVLVRNLQAVGDVKYPVAVGIASQWIIAVGLAWFLGIHQGMGLVGMWIAFAIDENVRAAIFLLRWKSGRWRQMKTI